MNELLKYAFGDAVEAFSTRKESVLPYKVFTAKQVHGREVLIVKDASQFSERPVGYDALITDVKGLAIGVRTADCVPILMFDPVHKAVAAVHAGWKSTVLRVTHTTIVCMMQEYKTHPEDLLVHIGPCISAASFQVDEDVAFKFKESGLPMEEIHSWNDLKVVGDVSTGHHLDLVRANSWLLENDGVLPSNIISCGIDTLTDQSFFSARRDGHDCGRIINSIKLI